MDGKITVWNSESFERLREIKDTVNGGILTGISIDQHLIVAGNDLMTKFIKKTKWCLFLKIENLSIDHSHIIEILSFLFILKNKATTLFKY